MYSLARRSQLVAGAIGPRLSAQAFESLKRGVQLVASLGPAASPSQPLSEAELGPGSLKRHVGASVQRHRLLEPRLEVVLEQPAGSSSGGASPQSGSSRRLRLQDHERRLRLRAPAGVDICFDQVRAFLKQIRRTQA